MKIESREVPQVNYTMGDLRRGGIETVGAFYRQEYARLVNMSNIIVGDLEAASEVVQGVFVSGIRVLKKIDADSPTTASAYFTQAVINRSVGHMRPRKYREISSGGAEIELYTEDDSHEAETYMLSRDPQEIFDARRSQSPVDEFYERISCVKSAGQQLVLILTYVDGLTESKVAKLLDIPNGTVKSYLSRGREAVRQYMEKTQEENS